MVDRSVYTNASPNVPGDDSGGSRGFVRQVAEHTGLVMQYLPFELTLTSGSEPNDLTATVADAPLLGSVGLQQGMSFWLEVAADNTGAMTISIDGEAAVDITDRLGAGLAAGSLITAGRYLLNFDGTQMRIVTQIEIGSGESGVVTQIFTSSGTATKPVGFPDNGMIILEAWGAGGGGARKSGLDSENVRGGMGGAYCRREVLGADFGVSQSVAIGAGGAGRAGSSGPGTTGGDTSIGSLLTAPGGAGGTYADGSAPYATAAPGTEDGGGTANRQSTFQAGASGGGSALAVGTSQFGGDGGSTSTNTTAGAGQAPGGGGGATLSSGTGGSGARGEVRIRFVWP